MADTVDASIPLQSQGPQPFTLNSVAQLMQMQQQIKQQKQQQAIQNSLAAIYANPANLGPDGLPNAAAIQNIGRISPDAAQKLTTQRAAVDEKLALTSQHQMEAGQNAQKNIQSMVRDPALNAYDEALKSGKNPQQAQAIAQSIYSDGLQSLFAGGYVPDQMKQQVPQNFDPTRVRANSLSYKDQQNLNQKQETQADTQQYRGAVLGQKQQEIGIQGARLGIEQHREARETENSSTNVPGALLDDDTTKALAEQYIAGDTSVMSNLGRGKQGAENIVKLRQEIVRQNQAKGGTGADLAASNAEYKGIQAGERALGTRTANVSMAVNEAQQFAGLALKASNDMPRGEFVPVNKALQSYQANTGDPKIRSFGAFNNSLINAYARAISPSGTPTVSDKDHAREMLSTADSKEQYAAVVGAMQQEMAAAQKSPGSVRGEFREAVAPKSAASGALPMPKAGDVQMGYRFKGGDPSQKANWEKE